MAVRPSSVSRQLLHVPGYLGVQKDVTWRLATDFESAIRLARAREQHELAYVVHLRQLQHRNSAPDLAEELGQRRETL